MAQFEFKVSFAEQADLAWILENDSHISDAMVKRKLAAGEYLIAKAGGTPAGCLRIGRLWSMIPFIEVIWVEDRFQRRGIGRGLVAALAEHGRSQGQPLILSSSQADEPAAQAFHRAVGFRDAGALSDLRPLQTVSEIFFVRETGQAPAGPN